LDRHLACEAPDSSDIFPDFFNCMLEALIKDFRHNGDWVIPLSLIQKCPSLAVELSFKHPSTSIVEDAKRWSFTSTGNLSIKEVFLFLPPPLLPKLFYSGDCTTKKFLRMRILD